MEVGGNNKEYPGRNLSNFFPHPFKFRGIEVASMEGFLQGLKFKSPEMQREVFKLVGFAAKKKGSGKNWQQSQTLWYQGHPIPRRSECYQILLNEAYDAMYEQNAAFRKALADSHDANLTHSIGRTNESETVLTIREFISRLNKLRRGEKLCEQPWVFPEQSTIDISIKTDE
jgi:predicted NAD-dependent protein-ADP-ribosyltransferase YbiA (DUF1768 family)